MSKESSRRWSRRNFLGASSAALAGGMLFGTAACSTSPSSGGSDGGKGGSLKWWDHYTPLQKLHKQMLADWSKKSGIQAEYTFYQGKKLAEAEQLARQSGQLPDVLSKAPALGIALPSLVKDGWFQPLQLSDEALGRVKDKLREGVHIFDGKVYSFPIQNSRWHSAALEINKPVCEKAGLDPANPPKTWDEFRAACRTVRKKVGGQVYGYMDTEPGESKWGSLAQAAGFQGTWAGQLYRTGEFALDSDPWLNLVEFLVSLQKDGLIYPGSNTTLKAPVARGRWAAGGAAYFFDGPWGPGIVAQDFKQFTKNIAVGRIITSDANTPRQTYAGESGASFFISADSKKAKDASNLLESFTTHEYYVGLAKSMDQPPLDMSVVETTDGVDPNYKQLVKWYAEDTFMEPVPLTRNPEVAKVLAEKKPVNPNFRAIATGVLSGQVKDARKALKQLSDKLNQDLDQAIKKAQQSGAKVSRDDFAFPDWQPGKDYAYKK